MLKGLLLVDLVKLMRLDGAYLHTVRVKYRLLTVGYSKSGNPNSEGKADSVVACSSREQDIVVDIEVEASDRASRSLESLRRKRLRRNKKKREAIKMMSKSERKTRYSCRAKKQVEAEILAKTEKRHSELKDRCIEYQTRYEKEKGKKLKSYRYLVFHILIYLFIGL
jgi:hypothetical protein